MKKTYWVLALCLAVLAPFPAPRVFAADQQKDLYEPVYAEPLTPKPLKDVVSRALELPFLLIKWPLDKALYYTEEYRFDRKTKWIYEKMVEYGFRPHLDSLDFWAPPSFGVEFDFVRIARQKENLPDMVAKGWINYGPTNYFQVGTELGAQRIAETGLHVTGLFDYENRRNESFYGIGPRTSRGDSTSYIQETAKVGGAAGYEFSPVLDLTGKFSYNHVNIKTRAHDGKGQMSVIFPGQEIPGMYGDDMLKWSATFKRDTRDHQSEATKGSYQKLTFGFTEGVNGSSARYLTYQLDAAKYFRLASPRRILAARVFGEFNQTVNRGTVPFFAMPKLGGSGMFPWQGQTERAFVYNRFTGQSALLLNLEYRYAIWQHRDFKLTTAVFLDEGQVSKDFATFKMDNFRESYGLGFYLSYSQNVLLSFSVAHGDEGTVFYMETGLPF